MPVESAAEHHRDVPALANGFRYRRASGSRQTARVQEPQPPPISHSCPGWPALPLASRQASLRAPIVSAVLTLRFAPRRPGLRRQRKPPGTSWSVRPCARRK